MKQFTIANIGRVAAIVSLTSLSGCAALDPFNAETSSPQTQQQATALGNIEMYTSQLADELFASMPDARRYRFAVAGFVPVQRLSFDPSHQDPLMLLGHQLEQGMMTEAARRGMITQDYKTTNDIIINDDGDRVFTRNIEQLKGGERVDFFISGTITHQQEGAIVNARVIHVNSKDVVAAATKFFPATLFWQREQVTTRNGMIYRTGS